jgi:seryl-tRNA synthetase
MIVRHYLERENDKDKIIEAQRNEMKQKDATMEAQRTAIERMDEQIKELSQQILNLVGHEVPVSPSPTRNQMLS